MTWDRPSSSVRLNRLRLYVQKRLNAQADPEKLNEELSLADAKTLIANVHGFEDWEGLMNSLER